MANTATRLITLIMLLQRHPTQKAADLAAKLGVSVRSLHRYMAMLDEMGIPIYSERGPYGGFSLVRGYRMPPLALSPEEAVAVSLGTSLVEELWGQLYSEAARGALAKLDNVLPDEQRREVAWAKRALVATGVHRADFSHLAPILEKVRMAVRERRRAILVYQSANQTEPQQREFDPYALVHRWGWWYVVGFCHLRGGLRTFRVDRIRQIDLTDTVFAVPPEFNIREYLVTEFHSQSKVTATLRFIPEAAHVARSNRLAWESMQEEADGAVVVILATPDLIWAASMALSYGPIVTVLEPPELRSMVRAWAQEVAAQYDGPEDTLNSDRDSQTKDVGGINHGRSDG